MIAGLITLALVGVLQSLGALVDIVPVEPAWRSDAAGENERAHAASLGTSSPDGVGVAAIDLPHRGEPALDAVVSAPASASGVRLRSSESRAPPARFAHASV